MTLAEKLGEIQQKMKAPKSLHNDFGGYNYRSAESILENLKPLLAKNKVTMTLQDDIIQVSDRVYVKAIATIVDTETSESMTATAFAREAQSKRGMDDCQVTGSASSYARKYVLAGLFLLDNSEPDLDSLASDEEPVSCAGEESAVSAEEKKDATGETSASKRAYERAQRKMNAKKEAEEKMMEIPEDSPEEVPFDEEKPKTRRSRRVR